MALYVNGNKVSGGGGGSNSVELTYEEYQALTPEQQLDGTEYFITDINGDGQQFQPICYSEEEREIGVWTDGKPLYQKSVDFGALPNSTTKSVAHGILNLGVVVSCFGVSSNSTASLVLPYVNHSSDRVGIYLDSTNVNVTSSSDVTAYINTTITIQYTKTTDQAGSGTWTPQGVPAHHYSTDEQVVGTWIDGSTLYEKTITNASLTHNTWTTVFDGASINAQIKDYEGKISLDGSIPYCSIDYYRAQSEFSSGCITNNGTALNVLANVLNPETLLYCTIRYTKSST